MANYGATSLTTLLQMVAHGLGITLIPEMARGPAADMRDVRIVPFAEPMPARTLVPRLAAQQPAAGGMRWNSPGSSAD